jgi:hypothetical protein
MTKSKTIVKRKSKKMGRPPTVRGENFVGVRLPTELLNVVDGWAKASKMTRSEAIRELIERGLATKPRRPVRNDNT